MLHFCTHVIYSVWPLDERTTLFSSFVIWKVSSLYRMTRFSSLHESLHPRCSFPPDVVSIDYFLLPSPHPSSFQKLRHPSTQPLPNPALSRQLSPDTLSSHSRHNSLSLTEDIYGKFLSPVFSWVTSLSELYCSLTPEQPSQSQHSSHAQCTAAF